YDGGTLAADGLSSTVPADVTAGGEVWTCTVMADDGATYGEGVEATATVTSTVPTWTAVWSHGLASAPPGSLVLDGGWLDQYASTAYDRAAWVQPSDWNVIYIPVARSSTTLEAVEVDVYVPPHATIGVFPRGAQNGYNGVEDYFAFGSSGSTGGMSVGYGGWSDGCCAADGNVELVRDLPGFAASIWHTVRVEYDLQVPEVRFFLDGQPVYATQDIPATSMAPDYVQLRANTRCCSVAADVAWTNLVVYEGRRASPDCVQFAQGDATWAFCSDRRPWGAAREACESLGGDLASIPDGGTDAWVNARRGELGMVSEYMWIGFNDIDAEGAWSWIDGSDATYAGWSGNEPNDGLGTVAEDCGAYRNDLGGWFDASCARSFGYICRIP
ncbi:MAG: hypothetical protein RLZZ299_2552, partial [Pseudomonadota bacterium]